MPIDVDERLVYGTNESHPYYGFNSHCTGTNNNTEVVILNIIRTAHPNLHVTPVSEKECDFIRWAKAGHAALTLKRQDNQFTSRRRYDKPESRVRGDVGSLGEHVTFGEFDLQFKGMTFQLYSAEWVYNIVGHKMRMFYLLSPNIDLNEQGYCTAADGLLLIAGKWTSELHDEVYVFDSGEWEKEASMWKAIKSSYWNDVILDPATKHALIDDVQGFFNSRALYREYSAPWKRGIIFHGPPGNGKTLTIKALANSLDQCEDNVATLIVKSFETCEGPQDGIRGVFQQARAMATCLIVFEDLDSLLVDKVRSYVNQAGSCLHFERPADPRWICSYFLNQVDGIDDNDGILIIGSTNHLERLDPAVTKRPSRFDRKYHFNFPSESERILYLEYWRKRLETNDKIDFDPAICAIAAKMTKGFSFAYMKELMMQALLTMARASTANAIKSEKGDSDFNADALDGVEDQIQVENKMPNVPTTFDLLDNGVLEPPIPESLQANLFLQTLRAGVADLRKDINGNDAGETEV